MEDVEFRGGPLDGEWRPYNGATLMHVAGTAGLLGGYYIGTVKHKPLTRAWLWRSYTKKHRWLTSSACARCHITRYQLAKRKTLDWPTDCLVIAQERPRRELAD